MEKFEELKNKILKFVNERNWKKFHSPCNLSKSISIEAAELLECFQWDNENYDLQHVKEELADVFIYCIQLSQALNVDIIEISSDKMDKNAVKYPIDKSKNNATKYDKLN